MNFLLFLYLSLFFLVIIHELGHFIVTRIFRISIERVDIGIGFPLLRFYFFGTRVAVRLIPLKGKILFSSSENNHFIEGKKYYQGYAMLLAGIASSFILAFVLFFAAAQVGISVEKPIIGQASGLAKHADLQSNDQLIKINGKNVHNWQEVSNAINYSIIQNVAAVRVYFLRKNALLKTTLILPESTSMKSGAILKEIGIKSSYQYQLHVISSENKKLQTGDIISHVNGFPVTSVKFWVESLKQRKVTLHVKRGQWGKNIDMFPKNEVIGITIKFRGVKNKKYYPLLTGLKFAFNEVLQTSSYLYEIVIGFLSFSSKIKFQFYEPGNLTIDYILRLLAIMCLIHIIPNILLPRSDGWVFVSSILKTQMLYNQKMEKFIAYLWYFILTLCSTILGLS